MYLKTFVTLLFSIFFFTLSSYAQKTESSFKVKGVCELCKNRIEEAALRTAGVQFANWDKESQLLAVVYNEKKVSLEEIQEKVASTGHSTAAKKADMDQYKKLPECCQYELEKGCSKKCVGEGHH